MVKSGRNYRAIIVAQFPVMPNASPLSLFNRYGLMAAFLATLATGPAGAQVIEIDAQGISHTRTASGLVEWVSSAPTDAPIDITALPSAALTPRESIIAPCFHKVPSQGGGIGRHQPVFARSRHMAGKPLAPRRNFSQRRDGSWAIDARHRAQSGRGPA
jgi:hypothetical protein